MSGLLGYRGSHSCVVGSMGGVLSGTFSSMTVPADVLEITSVKQRDGLHGTSVQHQPKPDQQAQAASDVH